MTKRLDQLKTSFDKLRKESIEVVGQANKIVTQGVSRLAEHELKALNDTYKNVLASLKASKSGDSIKDVAGKQLDMMQDTINRLIASARDSLAIVSDTRQELAGLMQKGLKTGSVAEVEIAKVTAQARKAVADVKTAAAAAQKKSVEVASQAKASANKVAATVQADAKKIVQTVRKDAAIVKNRVGSVLDIKPKAPIVKKSVVAVKPSTTSRASMATSKAKKAASSATDSAVKSVKGAAASVAKAVKNAG